MHLAFYHFYFLYQFLFCTPLLNMKEKFNCSLKLIYEFAHFKMWSRLNRHRSHFTKKVNFYCENLFIFNCNCKVKIKALGCCAHLTWSSYQTSVVSQAALPSQLEARDARSEGLLARAGIQRKKFLKSKGDSFQDRNDCLSFW